MQHGCSVRDALSPPVACIDGAAFVGLAWGCLWDIFGKGIAKAELAQNVHGYLVRFLMSMAWSVLPTCMRQRSFLAAWSERRQAMGLVGHKKILQ